MTLLEMKEIIEDLIDKGFGERQVILRGNIMHGAFAGVFTSEDYDGNNEEDFEKEIIEHGATCHNVPGIIYIDSSWDERNYIEEKWDEINRKFHPEEYND